MSVESVGLIGLGLLGSALAERLLAGGRCVFGYDLAAARRDEAARLGVTPADDAAGVVQAARQVLLSLPTSDVADRVLAELSGTLRPGQIVIDTTTGEPEAMAAIGARLAAQGIGYLDATVAGSSAQARLGQVTLLVGGDTDTFNACRDTLDALAEKTFHLGPCGSGAKFKLVHNLVLGLHRVVLAEGLSFAAALGLDPQTARDVLRQTPAASKFMDTKGPKILARDFTPQATVSQHLKDVRLILAAASQHGLDLPLEEIHRRLLEALEADGRGGLDNSAVVETYGKSSEFRVQRSE